MKILKTKKDRKAFLRSIRGTLKERAERMRLNPTPSEREMKRLLDVNRINYVFQVPVYRPFIVPDKFYIADFMIIPDSSPKFLLEVDGGYHDLPRQRAYDKKRQSFLNHIANKYVMHVRNEDVFRGGDKIIEKIRALCG